MFIFQNIKVNTEIINNEDEECFLLIVGQLTKYFLWNGFIWSNIKFYLHLCIYQDSFVVTCLNSPNSTFLKVELHGRTHGVHSRRFVDIVRQKKLRFHASVALFVVFLRIVLRKAAGLPGAHARSTTVSTVSFWRKITFNWRIKSLWHVNVRVPSFVEWKNDPLTIPVSISVLRVLKWKLVF